ncbi:MAG: hypothetical protein ACXU8S_02640 [Phenylobacterium sp.]
MGFRALGVALALTTLAAAPAMALTNPAAVAKGYKAPRDAWGHPDLAGVWSPATITRLERDPKLGDRLVLTEAEAAAAEGVTAKSNAKAALPTDQKLKVDDVDCGVQGFSGVACGYNNFWVDPGTKIMRVAGEPRASIVVTPKNGRMTLTPAAQATIRAQQTQSGNFDGPERRPLAERCLVAFGSSSGPPMLPVLYNNHYAIVPGKDLVAVEVEMVHDTRLLRVGGAHEPANVRKWMGDSVAHWEGETLVVDTVNFRPDQTFRGASANMHVSERFTRISPVQILYQFRVEDPATFAEPVEGEVAWNLTKDKIYEYACHEGNYALPGILAGARNAEKQGKEMEGARGQVKEEGEK